MLTSLKIKNYRNVKHLELDLNDKSCIIIGPNGFGKTNVLESIFYSVYGYSFKNVKYYYELIGETDLFSKVDILWDEKELLSNTVSFTNQKLTRNVKLNNKIIKRSLVAPKFPVIVFSPNSVDLVSGEPSLRRKDLDSFLSSLDSSYADAIEKYNKVLKNRNALLKLIRVKKASEEELLYWTSRIIDLGTIISDRRKDFFNEIHNYIVNSFKTFADFTNFDIVYTPNIIDSNYTEAIKTKFDNNIQKEIIVGKTLYGVHKDDFELHLNNKNLRYLGSRGQQRIAVFLLKMAQIKLITLKNDSKPLFLVDDVFSELDVEHRQDISNYLLSSEVQAILTSADENEIPKDIMLNLIIRRLT